MKIAVQRRIFYQLEIDNIMVYDGCTHPLAGSRATRSYNLYIIYFDCII